MIDSFPVSSFKLLAGNLLDGILITSKVEGNILFVNPAMEVITGYSVEKLESMNWETIFEKLDLETVLEEYREQSPRGVYEQRISFSTKGLKDRVIDLVIHTLEENDNGYLVTIFRRADLEVSYDRFVKLNQSISNARAFLQGHRGKELPRITEEFCKIMRHSEDIVWIGIMDLDDISKIQPIASASPIDGLFEGMDTLEINNSNISTVLEYGEALVIKDIQREQTNSIWTIIADQFNLQSVLLLPLITNELTYGIISLFSSRKFGYPNEIIDELQELADTLSGIIVDHLFDNDEVKSVEIDKDKLRLLIHDFNNLLTKIQAKMARIIPSLDHPVVDELNKEFREFSDNLETLRSGEYSSFFHKMDGKASQHAIDETKDCIVIVDDDKGSRELMKVILQELDYNVLEASDGEMALDLVKMYESSVKLVITDIVMPKFSGIELSEKLQAMYPEVKFCFISGFQMSPFVEEKLLSSNSPFISKPFKPSKLLEVTREILNM